MSVTTTMNRLTQWAKGKKTYLVVAATFLVGGLQACGVEIPEWVYVLLAAAGGASLRAGVKKSGPAAGGQDK